LANNKKNRKEVEELESSYRTIAEKKQSKFANAGKQKKTLLIIISIALLLCIIAGVAGYFIYLNIRDNQMLTANVTVAGVSVQGQTRKDAIQAVSAAFERNYTGKDMTITVGEHTIVLTPDLSAITFNAEAAIDAALKYTNDSDNTEVFDISRYIGLNKTAIMDKLSEVATHYQSTLTQHSYTVTGTLPVDIDEPQMNEGQILTVTVGTPGINLDVNMLYDAVVGAYSENLTAMEYAFPIESPNALDWEKIYLEECIPVVNAELNPETFEITTESTGYGFIPEEAQALMENAKPGDQVQIPFKPLFPDVTSDMLDAELYKDVLGEMTATAGYNADRNVNLWIACDRINNVVVMPGEIFSYNYTLGERNAENGWKPGASYVGGEVVMTYGGGICQVSSTLYYAVVLADLEIIERDCHLYLPSYIPFSTDATVSWGGIDFRFRNNTNYPIRIEASANGGTVSVRLVGTDEKDYYVKFISETVEWRQAPVRYMEIDEDNNPNGYYDGQVLDSGTVGAVSKSYRNKYDKETGGLISSVLENHDRYATRDKIVVKIIKKEVPTDPPTNPPIDIPGGTTEAPQGSNPDTPVDPGEGPNTPPEGDGGEDPVTPPDNGDGEGDTTPPTGEDNHE